MALHEALGKVLAALKYSTLLGRTNNRDGCQFGISLEVVIDTLYQRILGANNHHRDGIGKYECLDGVKVVGLHGHVLAHQCCTCIARSDEELFQLGALCNLPCQSVFAATRAEQKYSFHI